jgi:hypothetical protein
MIYGERTSRNAVIISPNDEVEHLKRVPYMNGSFNEEWLQKLIAENPNILPTAAVSNEYSPLICIGREVPVGRGDTQGYIDNLYVSPSGNIVIVETKLFRNQESRRAVVAQIIDYAKELQKWDCEKLNKIASEYFLKNDGQAYNIIDVMARQGYCTLSDEAVLTDSINKSLSRASFLLLIVGDGIRSNVQQLADFLNENTSMSFNLALAEMEVYQHADNLIVIPNLITKTTVIERHYISQPPVDESETKSKSYIQKPILTRKEFISVFADNGGYDPDKISEFISDMEAIDGLSVRIAPTELTIRFSPADDFSYALLTFSISSNHSDIWIVPERINTALKKHGRFPSDAEPFLQSFKPFINEKRCRYTPYENESSFYFANVSHVLQHTEDLITAAEQFANAVTNNENRGDYCAY